MIQVLGANYYIDIDAVTEKCKTGRMIEEEDGRETTEINIFKYEVYKLCLERILNEYSEVDDDVSILGEKELPVSFKIAFNTLIKHDILIEDENE